MAVQWDWKTLTGTITLKQTNKETGKAKNFTINIYSGGNCLAVLLYEFKDADGTERYNFSGYIDSVRDCTNATKKGRKILNTLLYGDIVAVKLNTYYQSARTLLLALTKNGYRVQAYYTEPKTK